MKLSIVATLYLSSDYLDEFCARATKAAAALVGNDYEIILVNDGSPDDCLTKAIEVTKRDDKVVLVDLSRNFGHHKAIMEGLRHASGDRVFLLDSDLEEEPEWLERFNQELQISKCDVVYGVQEKRSKGKMDKFFGSLFYRIFRALTGVQQPDNIVTARLMSHRYVKALLQHSEREINIGGLWIITGFDQSKVSVTKHCSSETTYSLRKKLSHLVNAVTSFSSAPLIATFYTGLTLSLVAAIFVLCLVYRYFFFNTPPTGYTSLIASIWLLAGLIILFIGVQGIYLAKIFSEVKQRPNVIVREVYSQSRSSLKETNRDLNND